MNKTILIIYAGLDTNGSTATLAQWIKQGVEMVEGITPTIMEASTVRIQDVSATNGIICGSGDYNGNPEPAMINFFDNVLKAGYASQLTNMQTMPFGVFATSAGYATGVQEVMQSMARSLLTFGGIYIGGGNWHTSQGVAGMTYATSPTTWDWVDATGKGFQSYLKNNAICYGHRIALAVNFIPDAFKQAIPNCNPTIPVNPLPTKLKPHHKKKKSVIPIIYTISLMIFMILFTLYIIQNNKVS